MRRQPVAFALIDAAFLADSKFRRLRRRLPEPRDFNSAVGAWLIVLTSARRNGLPDVDAADEAEDATFLPDLIEVGLLSASGIPDKPFTAWAPARRKYASDAPDAPSATTAPSPPVSEPSTPLLSTPFVEKERASNDLTRVIDYIEDRSGRPWSHRPGSKVWDTLEADIRDFGLDAVIATMTTLDGHRPDAGQLVFGATRRLHPIASTPTVNPKDERAAEEARAHRARLARTQRDIASYQTTEKPENAA